MHNICNDIYQNNYLESAFASNVPEIYMRKNILACINGHTHQAIEETLLLEGNYILFLSNPVGYKDEKNVGYNEDIIFKTF